MKFVEINFVAVEVEANSFKNRLPCALADMNESNCWFVEACAQKLGGFRVKRRALKLAKYIHCVEQLSVLLAQGDRAFVAQQ